MLNIYFWKPPSCGHISINTGRDGNNKHSILRLCPNSFEEGYVFKCFWWEISGSQTNRSLLNSCQSASVRSDEPRTHGHYRRFIVGRKRHGFVVTVPLNTYGGQGVAKHGFNQEDIKAHAVAHATDQLLSRPMRRNGVAMVS